MKMNGTNKSVETLIKEFEEKELNYGLKSGIDLFLEKYGYDAMKRVAKEFFKRNNLCDLLCINYKNPTIIDEYLALEYQLFSGRLL